MQGALILVIDDEVSIRRFLRMNLTTYGYKVEEAENANDALLIVSSTRLDLIILDLELPDIDGLTLLKKIRELSNVPVIILTVKEDEEDKINLLDAGADDYITKPFSVGELQARIRVALRHKQGNIKNNIFETARLKIDLEKRAVTVNNEEVKLTPTEYSLLTFLAKYPDKVVTQNQILKELWGPNLVEETQYLRIYILQLRKKIEEDPSNPKILLTEPGVGYKLVKN